MRIFAGWLSKFVHLKRKKKKKKNEKECSLVDHTGKTYSRLFLYTMCMT